MIPIKYITFVNDIDLAKIMEAVSLYFPSNVLEKLSLVDTNIITENASHLFKNCLSIKEVYRIVVNLKDTVCNTTNTSTNETDPFSFFPDPSNVINLFCRNCGGLVKISVQSMSNSNNPDSGDYAFILLHPCLESSNESI